MRNFAEGAKLGVRVNGRQTITYNSTLCMRVEGPAGAVYIASHSMDERFVRAWEQNPSPYSSHCWNCCHCFSHRVSDPVFVPTCSRRRILFPYPVEYYSKPIGQGIGQTKVKSCRDFRMRKRSIVVFNQMIEHEIVSALAERKQRQWDRMYNPDRTEIPDHAPYSVYGVGEYIHLKAFNLPRSERLGYGTRIYWDEIRGLYIPIILSGIKKRNSVFITQANARKDDKELIVKANTDVVFIGDHFIGPSHLITMETDRRVIFEGVTFNHLTQYIGDKST